MWMFLHPAGVTICKLDWFLLISKKYRKADTFLNSLIVSLSLYIWFNSFRKLSSALTLPPRTKNRKNDQITNSKNRTTPFQRTADTKSSHNWHAEIFSSFSSGSIKQNALAYIYIHRIGYKSQCTRVHIFMYGSRDANQCFLACHCWRR